MASSLRRRFVHDDAARGATSSAPSQAACPPARGAASRRGGQLESRPQAGHACLKHSEVANSKHTSWRKEGPCMAVSSWPKVHAWPTQVVPPSGQKDHAWSTLVEGPRKTMP
ncbi:hypothetical protein Salat_2501000 [Sesamum alatum]|uniref:Uncharacterized protein n=1 Tax=Sesamum alatum TaxID=300844 RepID=A0AAE1XRM5_9LAMI|nr:hypothetical protein Salat_2501000 [Sesamum alatum]